MKEKLCGVLAVVCAFGLSALGAAPARAQTSEVKEKPRMYTYVAFWTLPRTQWGEWVKESAAEQKLMDKGIADGQIIAYGEDTTLVHQNDQSTHDDWFSAMSVAGLMNLLDQVYKSGSPTSPVDVSATKHSDQILVSRYYNWHSGSWKDVYSEASIFKLKADAPEDAVDQLSKNLLVPLFEKLLADGTIHEYEIDTEYIHTDAPGMFFIDYIAANAEALDKVAAAIREAGKSNPLGSQALYSMVEWNEHRDALLRTSATYK